MAPPSLERLTAAVEEHKTAVAAVAGGLAVAGAAALIYKRQTAERVKQGPLTPDTLPAGASDCIIVGAGPSGSTAAYYIAKGGGKVALLDKATFPRGEGGWRGR
jgi:heterodisulfide reductase subunit A-like polyferredoxin